MADFKEVKEKMKHYKPAIYDLGVCYFEGKGVKENKKKAFKCFLKAAKKFKNVSAYQKLIECYTNGYGCKIDKQKAGEYKQKYNQFFKRMNAKPVQRVIKKDIHAKVEIGDNAFQKFFKQHTILACPNCQQEINIIESNSTGKLEDEYVKIWKSINPENDRVGYRLSMPNRDGETLTEKFQCKDCKFTFLKEVNIKLEENKKETYKNYNIKYISITKTNALVENILKESSGTYKEKRN